MTHAELISGKEVTVAGTINSALLTGSLVGVGVHVVVVDVFGGVLSMDEAIIVAASVGDVFPAGLTLVSVEHIGTIVPSEPSPHTLR
mgnify:CR=1 FL=1